MNRPSPYGMTPVRTSYTSTLCQMNDDTCHLAQDAAEARDDFRPVIWCRKLHKTGEYEKSSSGCIAVWTTEGAKAFLIDSSIPMWYMELGKFEKYTGEQR